MESQAKHELKMERKELRAELKKNVESRKALQDRNTEILKRLKAIREEEKALKD